MKRNEPEKIQQLRKIVEEKQYAEIDGVLVDLYSASIVVKIYDQLNEENRKKYAALSIERIVDIAYSLAKPR